MSYKWDSKSKSFVEQTGKGRSKNTAARKLLDTASKNSKSKSFTIAVEVQKDRPNVTPALAAAWSKEHGFTLDSATFEQTDSGMVLRVKLA